MTLAQLLLLISQSAGSLNAIYALVQRLSDQFGPDTTIEITGMGDDVQAALDQLSKKD